MERLRRLSIKTPGRITTISHHAGNKQGQSDILNFLKKAQTAAEMCRTAGEILPPSHWGGVFFVFCFFKQSFTELMMFRFKKWLSELMTSRLMACCRKSWVMQFVFGEKCDAGQKRPASAVSGKTTNRWNFHNVCFTSSLTCYVKVRLVLNFWVRPIIFITCVRRKYT